MSAVPAAVLTELRPDWRRAWLALGVLLAAVLLLYRDTAVVMVGIWMRSETFAHAFLVPPITLWLIWRLRGSLARMTPRPDPRFLVPMVAVVLLWLVADLVVVNAASQFALVGLLVLAVPTALGTGVARAILFPLMFLFFSVPFGEFMVPRMMDWTANFVVWALQVTGVPVHREGLQFVIPSGNWSVIDECSGIRYLMASFMVGALFAYLNYRSPVRRAVFMAVSLVMPILANWFRAYMIVMLGHLSGNKLAVGVDHLLYGWVFFGIVIFLMFRIGARWSEPDLPEPAPGAGAASGASLGAQAWTAPLAGTVAAAVAVLLAPHLAIWTLQSVERGAAAPRLALPSTLAGGWDRADEPVSGWAPVFSNPSSELRQAYTGKAGTVGVFMAYFRGQDLDRKLVSSQNGVVGLNDRVWNRVASKGLSLPTAGREEVPMTSSEIFGPPARGSSRRTHLVTLHAYWVDGRFVTSDAAAKLLGAWQRLRGRGDDGAVVILYAEGEDAAASTARLTNFATAQLGAISDTLGAVRDAR